MAFAKKLLGRQVAGLITVAAVPKMANVDPRLQGCWNVAGNRFPLTTSIVPTAATAHAPREKINLIAPQIATMM
jgi:hypothetical protein